MCCLGSREASGIRSLPSSVRTLPYSAGLLGNRTAGLPGCGWQDQALLLFPQHLADSTCSQGLARNPWSSHIGCVPATLGTSFVLVHLEAAASQRGSLSLLRAPQQSGRGRPSLGTSVCFTTSQLPQFSSVVFTFIFFVVVVLTFKVKHFPCFRNI